MKVVSTNKYANFNYFLLETFEAGIVLEGSEIKSIRQNGMTLSNAFVLVGKNKIVLKNSFVKPYQTVNNFSPKPERDRFLLLTKHEILRLKQKSQAGGLTVVPVKAYFKNNLLKLQIALARGKKLVNKKEDKKEQDIKREVAKLAKF